jgi:hypothetical protein
MAIAFLDIGLITVDNIFGKGHQETGESSDVQRM